MFLIYTQSFTVPARGVDVKPSGADGAIFHCLIPEELYSRSGGEQGQQGRKRVQSEMQDMAPKVVIDWFCS